MSHIKAHHNSGAEAFHGFSFGVYNGLNHSEALTAHSIHLRAHLDFLVEIYRGNKVTVDVGYNNVGAFPVDNFAAHGVEVVSFTEVEKRKIHRVVHMPQSVDVVESNLQRQRVVKRVIHCYSGASRLILSVFVVHNKNNIQKLAAQKRAYKK